MRADDPGRECRRAGPDLGGVSGLDQAAKRWRQRRKAQRTSRMPAQMAADLKAHMDLCSTDDLRGTSSRRHFTHAGFNVGSRNGRASPCADRFEGRPQDRRSTTRPARSAQRRHRRPRPAGFSPGLPAGASRRLHLGQAAKRDQAVPDLAPSQIKFSPDDARGPGMAFDPAQ